MRSPFGGRLRPSPTGRPPTRRLVWLFVASLAGCGGGDGGGPTLPPGPTALRLISGDLQQGPVGSPLPQPIVVQVLGASSAPMAGIRVDFAVEAGGGSLSTATATTNATGVASTTWTLGGTLGEQRLRVTSGTLTALSISATGVTGPPLALIPTAGNSQFVVVNRPVPIRPQVRVTDAFGNPVAGVQVTFSVLAGNGSIRDSVGTSNAAGHVELGTWTLGPGAGINRVRARALEFETELIAFGVPALVIAAAGDAQTVNAGTLTPVRPSVVALDGDGNPLPNVQISFLVESGGGALVGPSLVVTDASGTARVGGWITGVVPGANVLAAQVTALPTTRFTATGVPAVPAALAVSGGNNLAGFFGNYLGAAPEVRATDAQGNPVAGANVTYEITAGGGVLAGATPVTNFDGRARLGSWRLGPTEAAQSVRATLPGLPPVTFGATATAPPPTAYDIEVRFTTEPTATQRAAFDNAVARWRTIILGDLPDIPVNVPASTGGCYPALNETIDDLVIFAELVPIDGVGNILGSAGPCLIRSASGLTVVGRMRFDTADLGNLETTGRLEAVILHEMGHVIGIGTLWATLQLLQGAGGADPLFLGPSAQSAFLGATVGGSYPGGIVPVENTGGVGTRDSHWREAILTNELMTGFLNQGVNPLSAVTSASLRDLGYVVDDAVSDPFTLAAFLQTLGAPPLQLREVPLPGPIYTVSRGGRISGWIFR